MSNSMNVVFNVKLLNPIIYLSSLKETLSGQDFKKLQISFKDNLPATIDDQSSIGSASTSNGKKSLLVALMVKQLAALFAVSSTAAYPVLFSVGMMSIMPAAIVSTACVITGLMISVICKNVIETREAQNLKTSHSASSIPSIPSNDQSANANESPEVNKDNDEDQNLQNNSPVSCVPSAPRRIPLAAPSQFALNPIALQKNPGKQQTIIEFLEESNNKIANDLLDEIIDGIEKEEQDVVNTLVDEVIASAIDETTNNVESC
jgi:uncharacterized integral membrane protein